jgi:hypothetical protein
MAKSALHPWEKARPSPLKGALKKTFCAIFCAVTSPRTPHETPTPCTRNHPVIYHHDTHSHHGFIITQTQLESQYLDTNTRKNLPETSPKGHELEHSRALAGQRQRRYLKTQGIAYRPQGLENIRPLHGTSKPKLEHKANIRQPSLSKPITPNSICPLACEYSCAWKNEYIPLTSQSLELLTCKPCKTRCLNVQALPLPNPQTQLQRVWTLKSPISHGGGAVHMRMLTPATLTPRAPPVSVPGK